MLLGIAIGSMLYSSGLWRFQMPAAETVGWFFALVGRYPLEIYLLHLPLITGVLYLIMVASHAIGTSWGYL